MLPVDWVHGTTCSWEQAPKYDLPSYLQAFFVRVGLGHIQVFDTFQGGCLMRYQAVVQRSAWEEAWSTFGEAFKSSRVAYRMNFGGKSAPEIQVGVEPRYCKPAETAKAAPDEEFNLVLSKTFWDIAPVDTFRRARCDSDSIVDYSSYSVGAKTMADLDDIHSETSTQASETSEMCPSETSARWSDMEDL